jgi:hypothetical protein
MKNPAVFTTLMLLSLLLSPPTHAQSAADIRRDLVVSHLSSRGHGEFGAVNGKIKNASGNHYACVRLDFNLSTRFDMQQPGQPSRHLGVLSLEVRDIQPRSERDFLKPLPFPAGVEPKPPRECTGQITEPTVSEPMVVPEKQKVVLYENANFGGREKPFGIGTHSLVDFNDMASSIKVPSGLVVIVYEHSAQDFGYGRWVDFLEDQPNLAQFNLDNKISYLKIVPRMNSGAVWVRNSLQNGQFEAGHYLVVGRRGGPPPANPNPLIGPPIPAPNRPTTPVTPAVCTIAGTVRSSLAHRTYIPRTQITLHRPNGPATSLSMRVINGRYRFANVPAGTYEVRGTGSYPIFETPRGSSTLRPYADGSQRVTCERDGSYTVNFEIRNTEG